MMQLVLTKRLEVVDLCPIEGLLFSLKESYKGEKVLGIFEIFPQTKIMGEHIVCLSLYKSLDLRFNSSDFSIFFLKKFTT